MSVYHGVLKPRVEDDMGLTGKIVVTWSKVECQRLGRLTMETSKGLGVTDGVKGLIGAQCFTGRMSLKREGEREKLHF